MRSRVRTTFFLETIKLNKIFLDIQPYAVKRTYTRNPYPSRPHKSAIWSAFEINEITNQARCKKCNSLVTHNRKATSNLLKHAKKDEAHLKWFQRLRKMLLNSENKDDASFKSDSRSESDY